jgi:hypothetical protein
VDLCRRNESVGIITDRTTGVKKINSSNKISIEFDKTNTTMIEKHFTETFDKEDYKVLFVKNEMNIHNRFNEPGRDFKYIIYNLDKGDVAFEVQFNQLSNHFNTKYLVSRYRDSNVNIDPTSEVSWFKKLLKSLRF